MSTNRTNGRLSTNSSRRDGGTHPDTAGASVRRGTVRVRHEVARRVRTGHPWVYREAIDSRRVLGEPGSAIELVDWDGDFVAHGVVDNTSAIAVRVVSRKRGDKVDAGLLRRNIESALRLRQSMFDFDTHTALRLVNGESDGVPAVIVDRYADYLVIQLSSAAMESHLSAVCEALQSLVKPRGIYLQRRFKPLSGEAPPRGSAELLFGPPAPVEVQVQEGDLKFLVDVTAPVSTGLFGDLRDGRVAISRWAKGRRVLNLFSYTGAISLYAKAGGAESVAAVDVSAKVHARSRRNLEINGFDGESVEHIVGDALTTLAKFADRGRQFDLVCLDPPAFASASRGGRAWSASKDYRELISTSLSVVAPGGGVAAACSTHKMTFRDFDLALGDGAFEAKTALRIVERGWLPTDYPVVPGFPEGHYLKFVVAVRP